MNNPHAKTPAPRNPEAESFDVALMRQHEHLKNPAADDLCACCGGYPISRSVGNLPDLCERCAKDEDKVPEQCDSTLSVNDAVIRCQLIKGHDGEHSVSWDWEDAPPLERP